MNHEERIFIATLLTCSLIERHGLPPRDESVDHLLGAAVSLMLKLEKKIEVLNEMERFNKISSSPPPIDWPKEKHWPTTIEEYKTIYGWLRH